MHDACATGQKGEKGHMVSVAPSPYWPQRFLVLGQPQESAEQSQWVPCSMAASGEELTHRYRGCRKA